MTSTQPLQKDLVDGIKTAGLRAKVIVGGAPTFKEWANRIGADGQAENASEAVMLVKKLLT